MSAINNTQSPEPLDLDAIKARRTAISSAPWRVRDELNVIGTDRAIAVNAHSLNDDGETFEQSKSNMRFIAHTPTDIAALIAAVERLAELAEAVDADYDDAADWKDARGDLLRLARAALATIKRGPQE